MFYGGRRPDPLTVDPLSPFIDEQVGVAGTVMERGKIVRDQLEVGVVPRSRADAVACVDGLSVRIALGAQVGHSDGLGPNQNSTPPLSSWNSAHTALNCSNTAPRGGAGRIYCFAK